MSCSSCPKSLLLNLPFLILMLLIIPETRPYCSKLFFLEQYYSTRSLLIIILKNGANISLFVLEMLQLIDLKSLHNIHDGGICSFSNEVKCIFVLLWHFRSWFLGLPRKTQFSERMSFHFAILNLISFLSSALHLQNRLINEC